MFANRSFNSDIIKVCFNSSRPYTVHHFRAVGAGAAAAGPMFGAAKKKRKKRRKKRSSNTVTDLSPAGIRNLVN